VKDVVPALVDLMNCDNAVGKVINIGSDKEVSINYVADKVKKITKSHSKIAHIPYENAYIERFEDMTRRVPNTALAKELIGFEPRYEMI